MKELKATFDQSGYSFRQINREGDIAIFEKRWIEGGEDSSISFEVIRVQKRSGREMFGQFIPAHEAYPSSEQWGEQAWTLTDRDRAFAKAAELT